MQVESMNEGIKFKNIPFESEKSFDEVKQMIEDQGIVIEIKADTTAVNGFLSKMGSEYCLSLYTVEHFIDLGEGRKVDTTPLSSKKMKELEEFVNDQT